MMNLKIDQAKSLFFDRAVVTNAVGKAARKALSRVGGLIRKTAIGLIRTDKRTGKKKGTGAAAGKPPYNRTGLLRGKIFYAYEPINQGVVIGPAKLNMKGEVPSLLEFGGTVTRARKKGPARKLVYATHPYMAPSLEKHQAKIPEQFKNTISR